jgi:hypothetical protein
MANSLATRPLIIDTDFDSYRTAASALQGVRVLKLALVVGTSAVSVAGTVTITASDGSTLYPPLPVSGGLAATTIIYVDNPTAPTSSLTWKDFAVTGVTATKTVLYLWTEV